MIKTLAKSNYPGVLKLRNQGTFSFHIHNQALSRITVENLIDVGTCEGDMVTTLSKIFHPKNVYGFEPCLENCKIAQENLPSACISNVAVSNENKEIELKIYKKKGQHSLYQFNNQEPVRIDKVKCIRLDTWMKENSVSNIDFVKIDTQGNDLNVLKGLGDEIVKAKIIMTELMFNHDEYKYAPRAHEIMAYLYLKGFCLYNMPCLYHMDGGMLSWGDGIFIRKDLV